MTVKVLIPTPLRRLTDDMKDVQLQGDTVNEVIKNLEKRFPGLRERLFDKQGRVKPFLRVYVNGEDVHFLQDGDTQVRDGDEVALVPAAMGG